MERQPLLHDLLVATMAPTQAWSASDGQVRASGAQGCYHGDVRIISSAVVRADGVEPETIAAGPAGPGAVEAVALLRGAAGQGADPVVQLRRLRQVNPGAVGERLELTCATRDPVEVLIEVTFACDLADMDQVKQGRRPAARVARRVADDVVQWADDVTSVTLRGAGASVDLSDPLAPCVAWRATVVAGTATVLEWSVVATAVAGVVGPPATARPEWSAPVVDSDDRRLGRARARWWRCCAEPPSR